eukprot:jgi/Ulvmu1/12034/UM083_0047.1
MGFVGVHVGQCGIQTGTAFWELVDAIGSSDTAVPHELVTSSCSYPHTLRPLAVCFDNDARPLKAWSTHSFNALDVSKAACFYSEGQRGSGGNFANGLRRMREQSTRSVATARTDCIEAVMEGIRRQIEACSSRAHFFLTHSLAGGTGSGGGSQILQSLRDTYGANRYIITVSIAPSTQGDVPCQAFNSVLAGTALNEFSDCSLITQNLSYCQSTVGTHRAEHHAIEDLNAMIARGLAGLLLPLCPAEPSRGDHRMADLVESVTPLPALRFAEVHVSKPNVGESRTMKSVAESLCRDVPRYGDNGHLVCTSSALLIARGKLSGFDNASHRAYLDCLGGLQQMVSQGQRGLLGDGALFTVRHCTPCPQVLASATQSRGKSHSRLGNHSRLLPQFAPPGALIYAANRSSIGDYWFHCSRQAESKLQSNAYVHWYAAAGLMKEDLQHAASNMQDTANAYMWCGQ